MNTEAKNLLTKLAANAADFPAPPITDLTTHKGNLNTQLGDLATLEADVTAKRMEIDATCAWVHQPTVTKSKCALTGFRSGVRIWVRVRAIGPNGTGEWSDPATIIVP